MWNRLGSLSSPLLPIPMLPKINVYLNFPGTTEEAFRFYAQAFNTELSHLSRFKDTPDGAKLSAEDGEKVMHAAIRIGDDTLMATDSLPSMGFPEVKHGNGSYVSVNLATKEEADRVFAALSEGATIEMAMADMFWGDYFGSLRDRYGVGWMIVYTYPPKA